MGELDGKTFALINGNRTSLLSARSVAIDAPRAMPILTALFTIAMTTPACTPCPDTSAT
jgi:hypothetical protein